MVDKDFFGTHSKHIDDKTKENDFKHSIAEMLLSKIGQLMTSSSFEFILTTSALLKNSDSKQFWVDFWQIYYMVQNYWFLLVAVA